jgi:hypothetical protein
MRQHVAHTAMMLQSKPAGISCLRHYARVARTPRPLGASASGTVVTTNQPMAIIYKELKVQVIGKCDMILAV